jgi:hypothetical protein
MNNHLPPASIAVCILAAISAVHAQDTGIGTFNDLVGQAIESAPTPAPVAKIVYTAAFDGGKSTTTTTTAAPSLSYQPGLEYDYKFNQQNIGDRFSTNINEAHASFSIFYGPTKLLAEYFHVWLDASNDARLKRTSDADGIKLSLTEAIFHDAPKDTSKIARDVVFSLPFSFKEENLDALTSSGRRISDIDSYTLNPLVVFSASWALDKDDKERYRNLKLSLSPGFRLLLSDKDFTNVNLPNVRGWKGTFNLLPRVDYDITKTVSVNGSFTWTHYTNYYSSDSALAPDSNTFALAAGIVVKPKIFEKEKTKEKTETATRPLALSLSYQYDGFNRDFYQHSLTLVATYKF